MPHLSASPETHLCCTKYLGLMPQSKEKERKYFPPEVQSLGVCTGTNTGYRERSLMMIGHDQSLGCWS